MWTPTCEIGALVDPSQESATRVAAAWTSTSSFEIELKFSDSDPHEVSLYFHDHGHKRRMQKVEVYDASTGQMLSQHVISDFAKGKYMTWSIKGHVRVKMTKLRGPDAVLSGVFVKQAE
ncbi:MAG: hypothetical protein ACREJC_20995 [Tepidisphaeraceae bacterium]